ncbi:gas vesicle synthesis protein [Labilithrix luteola]|uniref:Gas vesicle synthesis protein n=1 Tax=Labilithrix luteola TaxID=1391654 RepID=A0A0K1PNB1_9BACT|nr:GvpL/GvpF family gas vesicle protein [Labilithrix luteola]AKU95002.1 gas vesicle synthesis protein [Labilithrix luteola]
MDLVLDASTSATYVYCVVKAAPRNPTSMSGRAPTVGRLPKGLCGTGKPRILDAGDGYYLLVTSAPLSLYGGAVIDAQLSDLDWVVERANEHEALVEHATRLGTVVPMKLFTLFGNDERALTHVRKMKRTLERVVEQIAGCEEWALRVLFDPTRAASAASAETPSKKRAVHQDRGSSDKSGTSFLLAKKAADEERRHAGAHGAEVVEDLYERLESLVRSARTRESANGDLAEHIVLDAAFLVPHASVRKLVSLVERAAKAIVDDGFDVSLSGPWPAYSFIEAR